MRDLRRLYKQSNTQEGQLDEYRRKALGNLRKYMSKNLIIAGIDAQLHYLKLNHSQELLFDRIEAQERANKPVRIVCLKSRRVGISTGVSGRAFALTANTPNTNTLVMAHLTDVTQNMFEMHHLFYDQLDASKRPTLKRSSKKELVFDDLNSRLFVVTAGTTHATRSRTIHHAVNSECAFYKELKQLRGAMEVTVPALPGTSLIWETTAFGAGNDFHQFWLECAAGETIYDAVFLEWFKDPACQLRPFPNERVADAYAEAMFYKLPQLKERQEKFGLSLRQIGWYYEILRDKWSFDEQLMQQEFPCTADEAFLATGTAIFNLLLLDKYRLAARPPEYVYDPTQPFTSLNDATKSPYARPDKDPYFAVWIPPQTGRHYLVVIDPSAGLETSDYGAIYVMDIVTQNIVASAHGRFDIKLLANIGKKIATIYNHAIIMPEANGLGAGLIQYLKEDYFHIYQARKDTGFAVEITNKLGFDTTPESRMKMIANARRLWTERVHDAGTFIPDGELLREIATFIQGPNDKPQAQKGCHDDRVMAFCMGIQGCLDELRARPDLAATIQHATTKSSIKDKAPSIDQIVELIKNPFYYGQPDFEDEETSIGSPFVPMGDLWED